MKILLIEDNEGDKRLVEEAFQEAKHPEIVLYSVQSLNEGIQLVHKEAFDVILLDIFLPDSRGKDTFMHLHSLFPHIPIIILTGLDDEEIGMDAVANGVSNYLIKDEINSEILIESVYFALGFSNKKEIYLKEKQIMDEKTGFYNKEGFLSLAKQFIKVSEWAENKIYITLIQFSYSLIQKKSWTEEEITNFWSDVAELTKTAFQNTSLFSRLDENTVAVMSRGSFDINISHIKEKIDSSIEAFFKKHKRNYTLFADIHSIPYSLLESHSLDEILSEELKKMKKEVKNEF
ncbi:MAG: hypothetical protein A2Y41_01435 [Spirochaetes bacterium GWB1_36_13]|nr:MAG: hypothetical protein A2Y41_01435 [Spirochaetes bacterium GWB1_36_13]